MSEEEAESFGLEPLGLRAGDRFIKCLDDEDNEYKEHDGMTMVPRCRVEGGIAGFDDQGDRRYGKGVTRRQVTHTTEDGYDILSSIKNFRPDGKECVSV